MHTHTYTHTQKLAEKANVNIMACQNLEARDEKRGSEYNFVS